MFYKKQSFTTDSQLSMLFGDGWNMDEGPAGGSVNVADLQYNTLNRTLYAAQTTIPKRDVSFGSGILEDINLFVNVSSSSLPQNATPGIKLYDIKDNYNLTEGDGIITYDTSGATVIVSTLDYDVPFMMENFDGSNKGYGEDVEGTVMNAIRRQGSILPASDRKWYIRGSNVTRCMNDGASALRFRYVPGRSLVDEDKTYQLKMVGTPSGIDEGDTELWQVDDNIIRGGEPQYDLNRWKRFGAYQSGEGSLFKGGKRYGGGERGASYGGGGGVSVHTDKRELSKEEFVDTYSDRVSQYNSIFNEVITSPKVYDIKVQSLETTGDTQNTFLVSNVSLTTDDVATDGGAARFHTFWENYSGSTEATFANVYLANILGSSSNHPMYQQCYGYISDIPAPVACLDANASLTYGYGDFNAELEIIFKVEALAPIAYDSGGDYISLVRGFHIFGSSERPNYNEPFFNYWFNASSSSFGAGGASAYSMHMIKHESQADSFYMFDFLANMSGASFKTGTRVPSMSFTESSDMYPALVDSNGNPTGVILPMGEWITMRIKYSTSTNGWGGSTKNGYQAYFPSLTDGDNQVLYFNGEMDGSWTGHDDKEGWPDVLSFALTNMRSINFDGLDGVFNINRSYDADIPITNDDAESTVLIDRITWRNFNQNKMVNASSNNPRTTTMNPINIPKPYNNVPASGSFGLANTGPGISYKKTGDNYFASKSEPAPFIISIGYDDDGSEGTPTELLQKSKKGTQYASWQFHTFTAIDDAQIKPITSAYIDAGYSHNSTTPSILDRMGELSNYTFSRSVGASGNTFWVSGGFSDVEGLVDNFTQKGFIHVSGAGDYGIGSDWTKAENPFAQARILGINGNQITVDRPELFEGPVHTERFVVYQAGQDRSRGLTGSGTRGYITPLRMIEPPEGNTITLNRRLTRDDLDNVLVSKDNNKMCTLLISPKKKWVWIYGFNINGNDGVASPAMNNWFHNPSYSGSYNDFRGYGGISLISSSTGDYDFYADATPGTTFNESIYSDGRGYPNQWSLSNQDVEGALEIDTDFGFGTYGEPTEEDPEILGGYMGQGILTAGQNYINIPNYVNALNPEEGDTFNLAMVPAGYGTNRDYQWTLGIDNRSSGNPPQAIFGYKDNIPAATNLEVSPSVDLLNANNPTQLAKGSATDVKFRWQEEGEDIWYRTLYVDTTNISNKYHKSTFWAPLNASGTINSYYTSAEGSAVNFTYSGGANTVSGDIAGFQGWGAKFNGTATLSSSASLLIASGNVFNFMGHCVPNSASVNEYICSVVLPSEQGSYDRDKEAFAVRWNANNSVGYTISTSAGLVSGSSTTLYDNDGIQPLSIVVTYDGNRDKNNAQLYINSVLEDTQSVAGTAIVSGAVGVGGLVGFDDDSNAYRWNGFLEEIVMTTGNIYVPTDNNNYLLDTSPLSDLDSSYDSNAYQARMFLYDFTNIRGKTPTLVAESNTTSWRVTGL